MDIIERTSMKLSKNTKKECYFHIYSQVTEKTAVTLSLFISLRHKVFLSLLPFGVFWRSAFSALDMHVVIPVRALYKVSGKAELLCWRVPNSSGLNELIYVPLQLTGRVCSRQSLWNPGFVHLFALPFPRACLFLPGWGWFMDISEFQFLGDSEGQD